MLPSHTVRIPKVTMAMELLSTVTLLKSQPQWLLLLSSLGLIILLRTAAGAISWLYSTFLRPGKDLRSYGSWAVVTGATDGIGKALAADLVRAGFHLILVGRNPAKLDRAAVEIAAAAAGMTPKIKLVLLDLADSGDLAEGISRLETEVAALDVGVLVNCAGVTYPHAMYFHEAAEEIWGGIVRVNAEAAARVMRAVVPGMVRRGRGAVINIGSAASVVVPSFPLSAVYAGTKAFIDQLSRSLYVEYKSLGIDVQCQIPLYVATKMVSIKRSSTFIPSPEGYAKAAVRCIGYEPRSTPYWSHSLQWWMTRCIPDSVLNSWLLRVGIAKRNQAQAFKEVRKDTEILAGALCPAYCDP